MKPIRILLADDHQLVRAGMRTLLQNMPGVEVVAETGDGREALSLVETKEPDVVLMDVAMPELNGLEATSRLAKEFPKVRVVIVSVHSNEEYVLEALRAGASGYVLKDASPDELAVAIKAAMEDKVYLSPRISKRVINDYLNRVHGHAAKHDTKKESDALELLTSRQREILQLVAEGHSTKEIASKLDLSVKTVETHRAEIRKRLDIHDTAGLVRYAIRARITTLDE